MSREVEVNYDLNYFSINFFFINKKMDGDLILGDKSHSTRSVGTHHGALARSVVDK